MSIIQNILHLGMQEDSIEEAIEFYSEKLGCDLMFNLNVGDFRKITGFTDSDEYSDQPWLTYIRVAPEEYLEIFNGIINPPDFKHHGIDHDNPQVIHSFALGCDSYEKTVAALEARDVAVENGFVTDPTGCKVKIVERKGTFASSKERLFNSIAGVSIFVNDLAAMSDFFQRMGMIKTGETANSVMLILGERNQYLELLQAPRTVASGDEDLLGHIGLQVGSISKMVWDFGNAGVRSCLFPYMRDTPFEIREDIHGNDCLDGNEVAWVVSAEGNRFEMMYQPGNSMQQQFEQTHPY